MIDLIKKMVIELLGSDNSGHDFSHVDRVYKLAAKLSNGLDVNDQLISLIALLHDVDDYKIFGDKNADDLINAKRIMEMANVDKELAQTVISEIKLLGYSKRLKGLCPKTLEGKIVSDADMCDAIGVNGVLRTYQFSQSKGMPFFDKEIFPTLNMTSDEYKRKKNDTSVCHMFEKLLTLKNLMLTENGRHEAQNRHQIIVDILYHLFEEEDVPEWTEYLDDYLNKKI